MISSAVIVAVGDGDAQGAHDLARLGHEPPALIPVLDRAIVARAVADLAGAGVARIAVLVDDVGESRIAAALAADGNRGAIVDLVRRDPLTTLAEAVDSARFVAGEGPFLLHFGTSFGQGALRDHLDGVELGQLDAVALMIRFDEADGNALPAAPAPRAIGEFHVGVFALGAAFPASLPPLDGGSSWMETALAWMERQGGQVDRRFVTGWWRQRPGSGGILAANRFALSALDAAAGSIEGLDATASDIEGPLAVDPTARIESSVIRGPVHIGAGARISDSFVGPFTAIGPEVSLDGVEIESSVVLEGSRISNIDGRLDSSVIGPYATVGKDFRLPRGTRLEVGPGAHVMLH
jgi:glucose-1-phosphate thymidylyltransferase